MTHLKNGTQDIGGDLFQTPAKLLVYVVLLPTDLWVIMTNYAVIRYLAANRSHVFVQSMYNQVILSLACTDFLLGLLILPIGIYYETLVSEKSVAFSWEYLLLFSIMAWMFVGNAMVIAVIARWKSMQTMSNQVTASLAATDMSLAVCVIPFAMYQLINNGQWEIGGMTCLIWVSTDVFLCTASICHLCAISINRYVAIAHPHQFRNTRPSRQRIAAIIVPAWGIAFAISMVLFIQGVINQDLVYQVTEVGPICTIFSRVYAAYSSFISFFFPLGVMIFAEFKSIWLLRVNAQRVSNKKKGVNALVLTNTTMNEIRYRRKMSKMRLPETTCTQMEILSPNLPDSSTKENSVAHPAIAAVQAVHQTATVVVHDITSKSPEHNRKQFPNKIDCLESIQQPNVESTSSNQDSGIHVQITPPEVGKSVVGLRPPEMRNSRQESGTSSSGYSENNIGGYGYNMLTMTQQTPESKNAVCKQHNVISVGFLSANPMPVIVEPTSSECTTISNKSNKIRETGSSDSNISSRQIRHKRSWSLKKQSWRRSTSKEFAPLATPEHTNSSVLEDMEEFAAEFYSRYCPENMQRIPEMGETPFTTPRSARSHYSDKRLTPTNEQKTNKNSNLQIISADGSTFDETSEGDMHSQIMDGFNQMLNKADVDNTNLANLMPETELSHKGPRSASIHNSPLYSHVTTNQETLPFIDKNSSTYSEFTDMDIIFYNMDASQAASYASPSTLHGLHTQSDICSIPCSIDSLQLSNIMRNDLFRDESMSNTSDTHSGTPKKRYYKKSLSTDNTMTIGNYKNAWDKRKDWLQVPSLHVSGEDSTCSNMTSRNLSYLDSRTYNDTTLDTSLDEITPRTADLTSDEEVQPMIQASSEPGRKKSVFIRQDAVQEEEISGGQNEYHNSVNNRWKLKPKIHRIVMAKRNKFLAGKKRHGIKITIGSSSSPTYSETEITQALSPDSSIKEFYRKRFSHSGRRMHRQFKKTAGKFRHMTSKWGTRFRQKENTKEKRAERTLILVFVCFVVMWLPFFTTNLLYGLCNSCEIPDALFTAFTWLGWASSGVNPCIYTLFNKDFRKSFKRILHINR